MQTTEPVCSQQLTRYDLTGLRARADAIVIDEAHHFRKLFQVAEGKTLFLLTATPVNNRLSDLQHMIEIFSRTQADYFSDAPLGIHSLPGHFRKMERPMLTLPLAWATATPLRPSIPLQK